MPRKRIELSEGYMDLTVSEDLSEVTMDALKAVGEAASALLEDPNADLIGYVMENTDHGAMVVTGTSTSCVGYVEVETLDGSFKSVKPAGLVRNSKLSLPQEEVN